ncbi:MAG TPA: hypothetical protein VK550_28360 [Polyangiaceae bacterium]|nr:hypothetical protein [Polyangiaceae bacterium]
MLSFPRWAFAFAAVVWGASPLACGDDSSPGSGGSAGASSGTSTGGSGGASTGAGGGGGSGNVSGSAGSGNAGPSDAAPLDDAEGGFVSCTGPNEPVDIYQPNLTKAGKNGVLSFRVVESDIVPPGHGINTWTVKVMQVEGGAFTGDLLGHAMMPDHTHPVTVQPEPAYDPDKGVYVVTPLYFFLSGYWRVTLTAYQGSADAGVLLDMVDFNFCIP